MLSLISPYQIKEKFSPQSLTSGLIKRAISFKITSQRFQLAEILSAAEAEALDGRAIVVKKLKPLPIEAVVRGIHYWLWLEGILKALAQFVASTCPQAFS
jgi:hypothetical protein